MKVTIEVDGETHTREVTLNVARLSMQQRCVLEETLGGDVFDRLFIDLDERLMRRPTTLRGILYCQLVGEFPSLTVDDIDADLTPEPVDDTGAEVVDMPMTLADGTEVEGSSGDPTQAASG